MLGALVILAALATAGLVAVAARLRSLVSTLLAAYLALVANVVIVTVALSPSRSVTRGGLAVAEAALLALALAGWWLRGRPRPPLDPARAALRAVAAEPVTLAFLAVVAIVLGYELVLALTVPPNNWDSLNYHLPRVASWVQYHGYHWIANAPSDHLNTRQPVAEQEIFFLFAATGKGLLFALPQYLAQLAILVAVYGTARRLGFAVGPAACSAALLATFSLMALEATTAQNDLVAASFPVVAACLLLGRRGSEHALAGAAVGIGIGVKLTTAFVWPVLVLLALTRGRRATLTALAGAAGGFVLVGMWGYVLNLSHTDHLLGQSKFDVSSSPSYPGSVLNAIDVLYLTLDLGPLSDDRIRLLWIAGVIVAAAAAVYALRREGVREALADAARVAVPFVAPPLAIGAGGVLAFIARRWGYPIRGLSGNIGELNRTANEDSSAFGPVGAVVLLGVPVLTAGLYLARRVDIRQLVLACALPSFLVVLALASSFNFFLTRFLLVPAALTAPLLARLFRGRATTAAYLVVASIVVGLVVTHDVTKRLGSHHGRPWEITRVEALEEAGNPRVATALARLDELVPAAACLGAVLGPDEPSYLLWGPDLRRQVVFLSVNGGTELAALRKGLFYVVISNGRNRRAADQFRQAGWDLRALGKYWTLAAEPGSGAASSTCAA